MGFKDRFKDIPPQEEPLVTQQEETFEPEVSFVPSFFDEVKKKLSEKIATVPVWFEYSDEEKTRLVETFLENSMKESDIQFTKDEKNTFIAGLLKSLYGFGELDFLLSDENLSFVVIRENEPVLLNKNVETINSDFVPENLSVLSDKLLKLSGSSPDRSVIKFQFKNLIITMVMPPVSPTFIVIKKKNRETTDFGYLLQNNKIDEKIYEFLISLLNEKKSILISGKPDSGKTSYVEAFLSAISDYTLLQESNFINSSGFVCENLSDEEFENLVNAVKFTGSGYLVCDLNNGFFDTEKALISTIRADSAVHAVIKLAGNEVAKRKLTEKQAKSEIAAKFNYIIQLDTDLEVTAIMELSLNKSGSLVMTEVIKKEK